MKEINIDLLNNDNKIVINEQMPTFEKFSKMQKLIKKESSLKEMCNKISYIYIIIFIFSSFFIM